MKWKKLLSAVLAVVTLCGCGAKTATNKEKEDVASVSTEQTGGFREKEITPQNSQGRPIDATVGENDEIYVLVEGMTQEEGDRLCVSTDKGETFSEQAAPWEEAVKQQFGQTAALQKKVQKDGSVFVWGVKTADRKPFVAHWENGELKEIEVQEAKESEWGMITNVMQLSDGRICIDWTSEAQIYSKDGTLQSEVALFREYGVHSLYIAEIGEELWIKNSEDGKNEFLCWSLKDNAGKMVQEENAAMVGYRTVDKQGNVYGIQNGLPVRQIAGGEVWEQLVSEREAPTLKIEKAKKVFGLSDGDLIVLTDAGISGKQKLLKYEYDETINYTIQTELKVYSLTENLFMEYAVNKFQAKHPDVMVSYEVGVEKNTGTLKEDALKEINARILAGDSPDVLILDGMSADGLIRQGLLADISGKVDTGKMFENIANAGKRDGKLYYVTSAVVPIAFSRKNELPPINDFDNFVQAAVAEGGFFSQTAQLFWGVWPAAQTSVMQAEGIDRQALERFFEDCKKIWGTKESFDITIEDKRFPFEEMRISTWSFSHSYQVLSGDRVRNLVEVQYNKNVQTGEFETLKILSPMIGYSGEKPFWTLGMAAVCSNAKQPELAEEFLQMLLEKEMQTCEASQMPAKQEQYYPDICGIPVTEEALDELWKNSMMQKLLENKEAEALESVKTLMKEVDTAITEDSAAEKILFEQMMACLKGEVTAEQAAQNAMQVLELQRAEKG